MPAGHCRALTEHFGVATLFILEGLWIPLFQSLAFAVMKALLSLQGSNVAVLVRGTGEAQGAQHSTGAMYDRAHLCGLRALPSVTLLCPKVSGLWFMLL